jgi:ABC-type transporter Mla subunit MlaD
MPKRKQTAVELARARVERCERMLAYQQARRNRIEDRLDAADKAIGAARQFLAEARADLAIDLAIEKALAGGQP